MVGEGYDKAIELLGISRRNMIKSYFEWFGIDVGWDDPKIQYRNYLADKPLIFLVPGGGHWEELTFGGGGGGIDITGKKIGFLGDSLTDGGGQAEYIKNCIKAKGGIPVCKNTKDVGGGSLTVTPKKGATLVGGQSFQGFVTYGLDFSVFSGCEHILTDLCFNDVSNGLDSLDNGIRYLTNGMSKVANKLKEAGVQAKVHSCGFMNFAIDDPKFMRPFGPTAQKIGKDAVISKIHSAQSSQCSSLGWHFLDPKSFSVWNEWYETSKKHGPSTGPKRDGIHIPLALPRKYTSWIEDILNAAFGSGSSNSLWTKEQLDQWRSEGTLEQNTGGKVKYENGKYYNFVGGTPGSTYDNGTSFDENTNYSGSISHNLNDYAPQGTSTSKSTMNGLVTTFKLATGQNITMHKKLQNALQAAFIEINSLGWFKVHSVGGYSYRYVNNGSGAKKMSNHSWGVAIDINAGGSGNPFFTKSSMQNIIDMSYQSNVPNPKRFQVPGMPYYGEYDKTKCIWTSDHPVVKILARHGFGWGGTYGDTMHFSALNGR